MEKKQFFIFAIMSFTLILACLTSCEKHDGIEYYKSKCTAEINGKQLIDQTRFAWGLGMGRTPNIDIYEYNAVFNSSLCEERGGWPLYNVSIKIFVDRPWEYLTETQPIKLVAIGNSDERPAIWDYERYCEENKISYATILLASDLSVEIVTDGYFQITSYDRNANVFKGKGNFSLQFSEGTLTGSFSIE